MNILHVIHRYPPAIGGSESWCAGLARWQAARGHTVTVVTLRAVDEDDLWAEPARTGSIAVGVADCDRNVRVHRCPVETPGPALQKLLRRVMLSPWAGALSAELFALAIRHAATSDVVHAHAIPLPHTYVAWIAARLTGRPFVLTPHFHAGAREHEHAFVRWLLRRADRMVVITDSERAALCRLGVLPDRIDVVTSAIEPPDPVGPSAPESVRAALGIPAGAPLLSFLGRKAAAKGLDVLFAALAMIRHEPAPVLALAGPSTSWYDSLPRPTGPVRVIDLPVLSEAAKASLLATSDVLVLPSRHEAFGIVFLEAWAAGTPVIGADIAATREVIGDAGTVFRPGDPADLAARIDAVLANPAMTARQVARGQQRLGAAHTWDHVGPTVEAAYQQALRARGRAPAVAGARPPAPRERAAPQRLGQ